jgi:hypothetical protein
MTNEDYSKVPPPHLRVASAKVSTVELNSKSSPNNLQIRSSDIVPPPDLIRKWMEKTEYDEDTWFYESYIAEQAAQWGADQELEACCEWVSQWRCLVGGSRPEVGLRAARRPKPPSLKEQSLKHLDVMERDGYYLPEILQDLRRAVEKLDD